MANRKAKFVQQQKIFVGVIALVVVAVLGYLTTLVVSDANVDGFVEGEHYFLIENPRRIRGDKIEVMEFFSYGCIHCYNFDDEITAWADAREDKINFMQSPAVANETWRNYGMAYFTMAELGLLENGHTRMFQLVHDARRNLQTPEDFADALARGNISEEQFVSTFTSDQVSQKVARADQLGRRYRVATVPSLVVHGKYHIRVTSSIGYSRMLDVAQFLIEKEIAAKSPVTEG